MGGAPSGYPLELPHVGPSGDEFVDSKDPNGTGGVSKPPQQSPSPAGQGQGPSLTSVFEAIGVAINQAAAQLAADSTTEQSSLECIFSHCT